ncbi:Secondary metabolism regulator LAE1 [Cladobotryum mycophilum]|uniref:Secondary metabolism regulator LAE1 n=1 Tax=Cladobotryum mycophilum TaxID=491253 RepID=A0ABR0SM77_9HYPO
MAAKSRSGCVSPSQAQVISPGSSARLQLTVGEPVSEPANEPEERILQDGFWEHGRFYGSWKQGKYLFPIDKEELNRLDILHKFFLVAREDKIFSFPLQKETRPRIMDLGTGTGIWAINVAEDFVKDAEIMAVDLNQIQPALIPRNVTTIQFDLEDTPWDPLLKNCDLIHMRLLLGSIQSDKWPDVYSKMFEHLEPGGYMEQLEVDWTPRWEGDDVPVESAMREWADLFLRAMDRFNRSARVSTENTKRMVEAAGFTDFQETTVRCYVNPWSPDRHMREVARWFNLGFSLGLEAMSMMPMIEKMNMTQKDVKDLCERVKKEICILRYHSYCTL